jgi:hypothetical protein
MTEEVRQEDAKVAVGKVKESINKIKECLIDIKENPTPQKIEGVILTLYLITMATANAIVYPHLVTWLIIVLPILILLSAAAFVMKKDSTRAENIWSFFSWFAQGTVLFVALATNFAGLLVFYSLPMYLFHRLVNTKIDERNGIFYGRITNLVQEAKA